MVDASVISEGVDTTVMQCNIEGCTFKCGNGDPVEDCFAPQWCQLRNNLKFRRISMKLGLNLSRRIDALLSHHHPQL